MLEPWGATGDDIAAAGHRILAYYAEPQRRYHTVEHLAEVLVMLGDLVDLATDPVAVELAAWFHDAVYDVAAGPGVNEAASAELAAVVLGPLRVAPPVLDATRRLIMTTAEHRPGPEDIDAGVLTDADLWILGAPRDRYRRYVEAVRQEYGWLDDAAWRAGRSAVVIGYLDRPRIYLTDRAHIAFDASARRNLASELAALGGGEAKA